MRVDLHQHLWPAGLLEALRGRSQAPRLDGWTLHLDGEAPYEVSPADHDLPARAAQAAADGVGLVGVALSGPLGIETLPPAQAQPLLDAWHDGAAGFCGPFGVWASAALVEPDPAQVRRDLDRPGVLGLHLPATALATPAQVERLGELFAMCAETQHPVLVHPGPAAPTQRVDTGGLPEWWPALVPYVAQQHSAWHAWQVAGAADHPALRIVFVALAGLAPLHEERLAARGGGFRPAERDPRVFYDTSSYGPHAVAAMARLVGAEALVLGSDRPYAEPFQPPSDPGLADLVSRITPQRLLKGVA